MDLIGLLVAVAIDDGIDLSRRAAADEQRPLVAKCHLARVVHAGGVELDREARRQLDLFERQLLNWCGRLGAKREQDEQRKQSGRPWIV